MAEHGRRRISIFLKLLVPMVVVSTGMVLGITMYFAGERSAELMDSLRLRAETQGEILAIQLRSAVAFDDRETAREVLNSVESSPDHAGAVLFDQRGEVLYQNGRPSPWVAEAGRGVVAQRLVTSPDRIAVVVPVESLEGPWGTLVIELSTERVQAALRKARIAALAAGALALVLALACAFVIARYLTRRLRVIARVAGAVTRGELGGRVIDNASDEIGNLARAFNTMVRRLGRERQRLEMAIEHLRHTEHELADANRELEARVTARTGELVDANRKLEQQMAERSRMELELRQAQKLESVGRLAAGVAHEINTPVQYVADSCSFLQTAVQDLRTVIVAYRDGVGRVGQGEVDAAALAAEMGQVESDADIDYALEQMPRAVARSLEGLERVATIVRSLKEFAHPERKERAWANLNRAITSTLEIARNEYKYVADLRTDLGDLPEVNCHLGELNQAVLNIVINAAHAIAAVVEGTDGRGVISVTTRCEDEQAVITISDTGTGIPPEIIDKIFDPFFTTKEVGKGTGQGLAIVRSVVVDKHGGKVEVDSELGRGTTFRLWLPINTMTQRIDIAAVRESAA